MRQGMAFAGVAAIIILAGALAVRCATAPPWLRPVAAEPGVLDIYGLLAAGAERMGEQLRNGEAATAVQEAGALEAEWRRSGWPARQAAAPLLSLAYYRKALALHRLGRGGESLAALLGALRFDRDMGVAVPPWQTDLELFTECVVLIADFLRDSAGLAAAPQLLGFFRGADGACDLLAADLEGRGVESFVGVSRSGFVPGSGDEYAAWVVVCRRGPDGRFAGEPAALRAANRHRLATRREPDGSTSVLLYRDARAAAREARGGGWHPAPAMTTFVLRSAEGGALVAMPEAAAGPARPAPEPKLPETLSATPARPAAG